ncbi:zinc metalloprotease HtpX [Candidatus Woesearchaeota archaeon]|nr:zinc metalloprotease HtpX [Candidatus Woesearchaeota archaeon]
MVDFYQHITANKVKSYVLLVLFLFVVILLGGVLGEAFWGSFEFGIIFAFIFGVVYSLVGWFSGQSMIASVSKAKRIEKKDDPYLWNTVEGLSIAAGIPMPKVYMIEEESMNAFATGRDPGHSLVCVTSGLRKRMNRQELEGVLAHELAHIKNYDIRIMMLTTVLIGVVTLLSDFMLRSFLWGGGRRRSDSGNAGAILVVVALVLAILAPIIAQLMRLAISRKREYLADANGALLTRYPPGLANALRKIRDDHDTLVDSANKATAHLYIENPMRKAKGAVNHLFSTHPDIDDRIKRLEAM